MDGDDEGREESVLRCPSCQSDAVASTLLTSREGGIDPNKHTCQECGYAWKQVKGIDGSELEHSRRMVAMVRKRRAERGERG